MDYEPCTCGWRYDANPYDTVNRIDSLEPQEDTDITSQAEDYAFLGNTGAADKSDMSSAASNIEVKRW